MSKVDWLKVGALVRNLDGTILKVRRITEGNGVYCDDLKNYCATQLEYLGGKLAGYRFGLEYKVDGSRPSLEKDVEIAIRFDNKMVTGLRVGSFDFSADSHSGVYWKITDERYNPEKQWPETDERIDNIGRNRTEDDMGHYDEQREAQSAQKAKSMVAPALGYENKPDAIQSVYERVIVGKRGTGECVVDVYRVLDAFKTDSSAIDHAIKKLLCAGIRGNKDKVQDYLEAIRSIDEALALLNDKKVVV